MIFLRPWWLLALGPIILIACYWWRRNKTQSDWYKFADHRLLQLLQVQSKNTSWGMTWFCIHFSLVMMVIALAGPSWHQYPSQLSQVKQPVMVLLELSNEMRLDDVSPTRLQRAKFLLDDLLKEYPHRQWGLMVFSGSSFLVSPITNDIQNILGFMPVLSPKILPVGGQNFAKALQQGQMMLKSSGYASGKILVLASQPPPKNLSSSLIQLNQDGYEIMWVVAAPEQGVSSQLAQTLVVNIKQASQSIELWLKTPSYFTVQENLDQKVMQWRDEGPWFLGVAMLLLLGVFRRGWFLRLWV